MQFLQLEEALVDVDNSTLIKVVYTSETTLASRLSGYIIEDIQTQALIYNRAHYVTGVLCYGNGSFLQCLEGQKQTVLPLMARIFLDKRHKNVDAIVATAIGARSFFDWRMQPLALDKRLWSDTSIQTQRGKDLQSFLPFRPSTWTGRHLDSFLKLLQEFERLSPQGYGGVTVNQAGHIPGYAVPQHQAFILVQVVLAIIAIPFITSLLFL